MKITNVLFPGDMDLSSVIKFHRFPSLNIEDSQVLRIDFSMVKSVNSLFIGFLLNLHRKVGSGIIIEAKNLRQEYFVLLKICQLDEIVRKV